MRTLTHLERLEAESIHVMREVVAEAEHPVMLYSVGKDSAVMLHLAKKAFFPSPPPFPLLHVDTTWKFRDMYALRDRAAAEAGMELIVHHNPDAQARGINPFDHGALHTDMWKTEGLKQALDAHGFDVAFGGARRDEEKSRAKERVFSFRSANHRWDPKQQRPELWNLYNARKAKGESIRVFPISNWTELDIWQYIHLEGIEIVPLYFSAPRPTVVRDGMILMVDDDRFPLAPGEVPVDRSIRFRTLGCYPLTGAVESTAATLPDVIQEMLLTTTSERQGRAIDHDQAASMEKKKQEGVFLMTATVTEAAYRTDALVAEDIDAYLDAHRHKGLLRFITCGSVDDGKSTLIGRLLYDSKMIFEDQLAALEADSKRVGTQGGEIDFALLVDGLAAEREQGITIDVAYRYFATTKRKFIVADTPGHEQYTRNMVTGASTADLAIILVDARKGILTQTRRHSILAHLIGIRNLVLAVNKMDLVGYDQAVFDAIVADYRTFATEIGIADFVAMPISGFRGDNITAQSENTPWYDGPTLMGHLENVPIDVTADQAKPFRMPVQWVNRPNLDFRGFSGTIAGGAVAPGDAVRVLPSGKMSRVARIVTADGDLDGAVAGQAVTLTLTDEIDCSRGDVLTVADDPLQVADQFEATIVWMADEAMLPGRSYWLKTATHTVGATVQTPKYQINVNTSEHLAAKTLELNAIGVATVATDRPIAFEPYAVAGGSPNRVLGGFILIDRITNATVAAGMLHFALRRSQNVHWQATDIDRGTHAALKNQQPAVLWFTGLSGAGKSTIANAVERKLVRMNRHTFLLDGDNVRHGLNKDLGFTDADRVENVRRVGEVAKLMCDAGLIVITAFISPFRAERAMVRAMMPAGEFIEIHVDTPLADAEARDVKGLYAKARAGQLTNFTGIDSPYEAPEEPEIQIDTRGMTPDEAADVIIAHLIP